MHFQACHASRPVAGGRAGDQTRALLRLPTAVCVQLAGIAHQARVRFSRRGRSRDRLTPQRRRAVLCMHDHGADGERRRSMPNGCVGVVHPSSHGSSRISAYSPPAYEGRPRPAGRAPCRARARRRARGCVQRPASCGGSGISSAATGTSMSGAEAANAHGGCQRLSAAWSPSMAPPSPDLRGWTSFHFPSAGGR